jgi:hypothetical protein
VLQPLPPLQLSSPLTFTPPPPPPSPLTTTFNTAPTPPLPPPPPPLTITITTTVATTHQPELSKAEQIRANELAAFEKIKQAQAKHDEAKNSYEWLMQTQDHMRVLGDKYVPEAQSVKFNKSELQKALKAAQKNPKV